MTSQGAAADNTCRDGAARGGRGSPHGAPARHGPPTARKRLGPRKVGVQVGSRKPDRGSQSHGSPGASRRSIPFLWKGKGKQGEGLIREPEKHRAGTAERWLRYGDQPQERGGARHD